MIPMTTLILQRQRLMTPLSMLRSVKLLGCLTGLLLAVQSALAFSLLGPVGGGGDGYQTPTLSYNMGGDIGAPKNLAEEYRLNVPQIFWAADSSYLDYFGSNGLWAAEQAFGVFNSLTNVSSYSENLTEFPLDSQRINYTAQAFSLLDVKSALMEAVIEHMGLAEPDRWTWCLRDRESTPVQCFFFYEVIQRNYDPVTWQYSRYVNATRYTYQIFDGCPVVDRADAIEYVLDPLTPYFSAVASWGANYGGYYTTLTRDDVGGLRYLYRKDNMNVEQPAQGSLLFQTNLSPQVLYTSNLTMLAFQSLTNDAAGLQALYPDLTILSTTNYFDVVWVTNVVAYFTNYPWSPAGTISTHLQTNAVLTVEPRYRHLFGNIEVVRQTNGTYYSEPVVDIFTVTAPHRFQLVTSILEPPVWSPVGTNSFVTNNITKTFYTNTVAGEYFVVPTNSCALSLIAPLVTNVTLMTNVLFQNTNLVFTTNALGGSDLVAQQVLEQSVVEYFTNRIFLAQNVICVTNNAELRQGIEKISFIRKDFDSLLGRFFVPFTNDYSGVALIQNRLVEQRFRRFITAPDILIQAGDLGPLLLSRSINFGSSNLVSNLAGPGTIEPFTVIALNKVGPLRFNSTDFADETTSALVSGTNFIWASYDGTTNAPIIYPDGTTIRDLENQMFIDVQPSDPVLPDGRAYVNYATTFGGWSVQGGQQPYNWSSSSILPEGLSLAPSGAQGQYLSLTGSPVKVGQYTLVIRVTDAGGRFVDMTYSLTIKP